eukprot:scaffold16824_cov124-Isochrysis_galbana.AAC.1
MGRCEAALHLPVRIWCPRGQRPVHDRGRVAIISPRGEDHGGVVERRHAKAVVVGEAHGAVARRVAELDL